VTLGSSSPVRGFTVTNIGPATSEVFVLSSDDGEFTIHSRLVGSCVSGVTTLAPGASCLVSVVFTPAASGSRSGTISFSASSGARGSVNATGEGTTSSRPATLSVLAGLPLDRSNVDGKGPAARFYSPWGPAVDASDNVWVADRDNNTIRKVTPAGEVITVAGAPGVSGAADGIGAAARFNKPSSVAVDESGTVYVADAWNYTIRKITPEGMVTTFAGAAGARGSTDGAGPDARFSYPDALALDQAGNVLVADTSNGTIRSITPEGLVTTFAGTAGSKKSVDGIGPDARFASPASITVDALGWILVLDGKLRKISPDGVVTTLDVKEASPGKGDTLSTATFSQPNGVAVDGTGNVFVADSGSNSIYKVTPAGIRTTLAGGESYGSADGAGAEARFKNPRGLAIDRAGNILVGDADNDTIRKISPAGVVTTLAGTAAHGYADGAGANVRFDGPSGAAVNQAGDIFVADHKAIRKITPAGVVTTLARASTSVAGIGVDDDVLHDPFRLALDTAGNVFVSTMDDSIQKVTPSGAVTTIARGLYYSGIGIAVNAAGDLFVTATRDATILAVTPAGAVSLFPGRVGVSGCDSGEWTHAFSYPCYLVIDGEGNLIVTDSGRIFRITPDCTVSTLAGGGPSGQQDGPGAEASFENPTGLAIDGAGNLFVADRNTIRKITPAGMVSTVVGGAAQTSVSSAPLPASMKSFGLGLAVSPLTGDLYITIDSAVLVVSL
jgi:sugar lactone lactonase YvrE